MPSLTPMERFITLIKGEENLPPKLPPPPPRAPAPVEDEPVPNEHFGNLPSVESVIAESVQSKAPKIQAPAKLKENAQRKENVQPDVQPDIQPVAPVAAPPSREVSDTQLLSDPHMGEAAPRGIHFSPFLAVTKFCYKFVKHDYQQPLATAFFDASKIWNRDWDLYYIWSDHYPTAKALTFVPEHQLQALLDEINQAFPEVNVSITDELRDDGLVINFDGLPDDLRPRWLGHSTSRTQHDHWVASLPPPASVTAAMADRDLEAFKAKMNDAVEIAKAKSKAQKKDRQEAASRRKLEAGKQVLRAQRYLGLMPKKEEDLMPGMASLSIATIEPSKPSPHPFDLDVIIICIDCEAYERYPKLVTEVGVATLDTRDLSGDAPGTTGTDWHKHIRGRHFRIIEYKHLVNRDFCEGAEELFDFGQTEFVGKDHVASVLTSCFHQPFSKRQEDGSAATTSWVDGEEEKRNIILLGHDVAQDINYLKTIGFSVLNRGNLLEVLDTAEMYKAYSQEINPMSLGNMCYQFNLTAWHPHNAGNDAVHTLWAFLAIAVKDASQRGNVEVAKQHAADHEKKAEAAIEQAKERAKEDSEGWTLLEDDDGGVAVPSKEEDFESKKTKRPFFGPPRPPASSASGGLYTMGGAPLDV